MGAWGEEFFNCDSMADSIGNVTQFVFFKMYAQLLEHKKFKNFMKDQVDYDEAGISYYLTKDPKKQERIVNDFIFETISEEFMLEKFFGKQEDKEKVISFMQDFVELQKIKKNKLKKLEKNMDIVEDSGYLEDVNNLSYLTYRLSKQYGVELRNENIKYFAFQYLANQILNLDTWVNQNQKIKILQKENNFFFQDEYMQKLLTIFGQQPANKVFMDNLKKTNFYPVYEKALLNQKIEINNNNNNINKPIFKI